MINPTDFWELMQPLTKKCQPMDPEERTPYYEDLKRFRPDDLREAVHKLWRGWTWHRWPTVEEIEEAIKDVNSEKSYAFLDEVEAGTFCKECHNAGRFVDENNQEGYCSCPHGIRWRRLRKKQGFKVNEPLPKKEKLPYKDEAEVPF